MNKRTIQLKIEALDNAAEFIRSHPECGWLDEEEVEAFGSKKEFKIYAKQCESVYNQLTKQADKLRLKIKL